MESFDTRWVAKLSRARTMRMFSFPGRRYEARVSGSQLILNERQAGEGTGHTLTRLSGVPSSLTPPCSVGL
jgi:hypothetical protein